LQICKYTPKAQNETVKQKLKEKFIIEIIDTRIHPRAVMIKLQNAVTTNRAMVASIRFDAITFVTVAYA
uniref:Prohibitin n=1 Tax=Brugia timori TaxID=42155 RepID=A0A0R3QF97_9BILA